MHQNIDGIIRLADTAHALEELRTANDLFVMTGSPVSRTTRRRAGSCDNGEKGKRGKRKASSIPASHEPVVHARTDLQVLPALIAARFDPKRDRRSRANSFAAVHGFTLGSTSEKTLVTLATMMRGHSLRAGPVQSARFVPTGDVVLPGVGDVRQCAPRTSTA